jgi:hypothetical protein
MKNQNNKVTAVLFVVTLALAPMVQAQQEALRPPPTSLVRPTPTAAYEGASENSEAPEVQNLPAITIHSADNVIRGKTGSFVLNMKPALMFGGTYVNFSIGGTAVAGVDYVAVASPAYLGSSGYGTILIQTLPDPRGLSNRQSYSVVITLQSGAGYALGNPGSAVMWIKP